MNKQKVKEIKKIYKEFKESDTGSSSNFADIDIDEINGILKIRIPDYTYVYELSELLDLLGERTNWQIHYGDRERENCFLEYHEPIVSFKEPVKPKETRMQMLLRNADALKNRPYPT